MAKRKSSKPKAPAPQPAPQNRESAAYQQSTAREGQMATGTTIGPIREYNPAEIAITPEMAAAQIAPTTMVGPREIGAARTVDIGGSEYYQQQRELAQALAQQAAGKGPSVATLQLQQGLERALKGQMGALAAQPGVSQGLAARLFGGQAAAQRTEMNMAAAQARVQEQLAAQQQLAGVLSQGRGQDIAIQQANQAAMNERMTQEADLRARIDLANQLAGNTQAYNQAQLVSQANLTNADIAYKRAMAQAELQDRAAAANQAAYNTRNIQQANIAGGIEQARLGGQATLGAAQAGASATKYAADVRGEADIFGNIQQKLSGESVIEAPTQPDYNRTITGGSQDTGAGRLRSDKNAKTDVKDGSKASRDMLEKLAAAIYKYKNSKDGKGPQLGVMAQDLEKSKLGRQMVDGTPGSKTIDFAKGLGAMMASMADMHKRLKQVEKSK